MSNRAAALTRAQACQRDGQWQAAEQIYRDILAVEPQHADAWALLGILASQVGNYPAAADALRRACELRPTEAAFHGHLGAVYQGCNRLDEALACYRQALELRPNLPELHFNLGTALQAQGQAETAAACYRQALELRPAFLEALNNLGCLLAATGQLAEAVLCFRRILTLQPTCAEAHANLGSVWRDQGLRQEAIACYRQALALDPHDAETHQRLGQLFLEQGQLADAVNCFRRDLALRPEQAQTHNNLGTALQELDPEHLDEALACYRRALELQPDYADAHNNLGAALQGLGQVDEALACYRRALELRPDSVKIQHNLGEGLRDQGEFAEAIACYRRALELQPDAGETQFSLSLALLAAGDFARGWNAYEARWRAKLQKDTVRSFAQPSWDGKTHPDQSLLLYAEQGLGDTLQFIRYAALVKPRCRQVIFECPRALLPLLSRIRELDQLVAQGETLPEFDTQAPLLSLPRILGTELATIPAQVPYLSADPQLVGDWQDRLREIPGFRVGINWQGRPGPGRGHVRNIPLRHFAPLAELPGVRLISLQQRPRCQAGEEDQEPFPLIDFGDDVDQTHGALMDTAAIMRNLDLVVTSDTSVAHLAGGLGVPVWVALPWAADWRWLRARSDSPWYPTMRLFRQPRWGDWASVFRDMEAILRDVTVAARCSCQPCSP